MNQTFQIRIFSVQSYNLSKYVKHANKTFSTAAYLTSNSRVNTGVTNDSH